MKKIERRLISVVSGFDNKNSRSKDSRKLLNWGYKTQKHEISKKGSIFEIKSWLGKENFIKGITKDDVFVTINKKSRRNFIELNMMGLLKLQLIKVKKLSN